MKKFLKIVFFAGLTAAFAWLAFFLDDYTRMKRVEAKLNSMPIHRLKEKAAEFRSENGGTVVRIPDSMPYLGRLQVCADILHHRKEKNDHDSV